MCTPLESLFHLAEPLWRLLFKICLPVYGDIFYEVCSLCVCDDDAFRWDCQSYFPKLLSTGSGLWVWKIKTHIDIKIRQKKILPRVWRSYFWLNCKKSQMRPPSKTQQPACVVPEMWGICKRWQNGGRDAAMWSPEWALEVGLAAIDSPCRSAPSGVAENTAIVLSLRSVRAPVDEDNDLLAMQLASKWEQFSFTPKWYQVKNQ